MMKNWIFYCILFFRLDLAANAQPVITRIEPPSAVSGLEITVFGADFDPVPSNNTVTFAGVSAIVSTSSVNHLVVTVPATTVGPGEVIVTNGNGTANPFTFTVLSNLSPGCLAGETIISSEPDEVISVFAADLDGDGDMDILSASRRFDKIAWYENTDGAGTFGPQQVITTMADQPDHVWAADLDGDGDIDAISASMDDNKIAWYENTDGLGTFGAQQVITTNADGAVRVNVADIDQDGDIDVISASQNDDKIAWYENTDGNGTFGAEQVISVAAITPLGMYTADLDGDGDFDVLSASIGDGKIAWYENDGAGMFGPQEVIDGNVSGAIRVRAGDFDGDGDLDVLSTENYGDVSWYENIDGSGTFGPARVISEVSSVVGLYAGDLDGDGDLDVLTSSVFSQQCNLV